MVVHFAQTLVALDAAFLGQAAVRGGAGGEEAALFSASLFRMYSMYAETKRWKTEILNAK